jgi:hypothetical protein
VSLDSKAWKEVTDQHDDFLTWLPELEAESARRRSCGRRSLFSPSHPPTSLSRIRAPTMPICEE